MDEIHGCRSTPIPYLKVPFFRWQRMRDGEPVAVDFEVCRLAAIIDVRSVSIPRICTALLCWPEEDLECCRYRGTLRYCWVVLGHDSMVALVNGYFEVN